MYNTRPPTSLWRNTSFLRLWLAQIVSNAGSSITNIALPVTAVLVLGATPAQMGLLAAAGSLPNLVFSLFAGVWVDRTRRRPIMVWTDLGRALLLGSIAVAAAAGYLTFAQLYVVAFAAGTLGVFFTIASVAVLPSVVRKQQLVEANSAFAMSDSVLAIAGPGAAGALIQLVGAPRALIVDAVSYLVSALSIGGLAEPQPKPARATHRRIWGEIGEGLHELVRTPLLRALTLSAVTGAFGSAIQGAVWYLFLLRELELGAAGIGLLGTAGGIASLAGAALAGRASRRFGVGPAIIVGQAVWMLGALLPVVAGIGELALVPLLTGTLASSIGATIYTINQTSVRQSLTDTSVLGRVTAARRFLVLGAAPLGAALGGLLGGAVGLRTTLLLGAIGPIFALALVAYSPVCRIRTIDDPRRHANDVI